MQVWIRKHSAFLGLLGGGKGGILLNSCVGFGHLCTREWAEFGPFYCIRGEKMPMSTQTFTQVSMYYSFFYMVLLAQ